MAKVPTNVWTVTAQAQASSVVVNYSTLPYPTLPYPTIPYPTLPYPTLPYSDWWWAVDVFFWVDVLINFNTGYRSGPIVVSRKNLVALNYIKGWLLVDVLSLVRVRG